MIWGKIVDSGNDSAYYLTFQSMCMKITFMYIIVCPLMSLIFLKTEIFFSSPGTIKWISGRITG